ncbi:MAG: hypothetical protein GXP04_08415 [Alphaproteobacteria bacterium]|nr:hypothetical protein [Alphaproteobacteria bacterium]
MSDYFPTTEEIESGRFITPGQAIHWLENTKRTDGYFDGAANHSPLRYLPDIKRAAFVRTDRHRLLPEDGSDQRPDRAFGFPCSFWTADEGPVE